MFANRYGPWAVIVGGSEGVGAGFARQLAEQGLNLVLIARKPEPLEVLANEVRGATKSQVRCLQLDITAPDMLERVVAVTADIDVGLLVYNAGSATSKSFLDSPLQAAINTLELNPIGQVKLAHHFGSKMKDRGRGGMIFIGSVAGVAGGGGTAAYSASKAFTQVFAEALWAELKPAGIDVLGFIIGATRTPFLERAGMVMDHPDFMAADPEDVARQALENITNGPTQLPQHLEEQFRHLLSLSRREATEMMTAGVAAVKGM